MYTDQTLEFEKVETSNGTFRDEIILFLKNNGLGKVRISRSFLPKLTR